MLSIIIPTLNEEKHLPLLLEEIKKQNFSDKEVIVADAGSTDRTVKTALYYGSRVVQGGLPAKGRNEGAKAARGDIFLFLDADNEFLPRDFLKKLLREFKKRELDIASFPIFPNGKRIDKMIYRMYNSWAKSTQKFLPYATNSILVKREIHRQINGFDEEIRIAEDHDYARRGARVGKFGFIKTEPVLVSPRRFEKDGRMKIYLKYLFTDIHMIFVGPVKSDIFRYRFNHYIKK